MPSLDTMVEPLPRDGSANPLMDLYASGSLPLEQPTEMEKFTAPIHRWREAQHAPTPEPQNWREMLAEKLPIGMMALGPQIGRFTPPPAVKIPSIPPLKPLDPFPFSNWRSRVNIDANPANSNLRFLKDLHPAEQMEYERLQRQYHELTGAGRYGNPHDDAVLTKIDKQIKHLRRLRDVRARAKALGIDVME